MTIKQCPGNVKKHCDTSYGNSSVKIQIKKFLCLQLELVLSLF